MCYWNLEESSAEVVNPQNSMRMMVGYRGLQHGCLVYSLCFCTKCECTHIQWLLCTLNGLHDVGWVSTGVYHFDFQLQEEEFSD